MAKRYFYSVLEGRHPGIYESWEDCRKEVIGFKGAVYKKFETREEAEELISEKAGKNPLRSKKERGVEKNFLKGKKTRGEENIYDIDSLDVKAVFKELDTDAAAYVDGSFKASSGIYGYGVLLFHRNGNYDSFKGSGDDKELAVMRNVAGEISGSMRAVEEAYKQNITSITLFYDYMGIECWATGAWKRNKKGTEYYHDFMKEYMSKMDVQFKKVRAHTGVRFNEYVDRLAKGAVGIKG